MNELSPLEQAPLRMTRFGSKTRAADVSAAMPSAIKARKKANPPGSATTAEPRSTTSMRGAMSAEPANPTWTRNNPPTPGPTPGRSAPNVRLHTNRTSFMDCRIF
jgi:hypothetical protein